MNLAPFRKAIAPALLAVVATITSWIATGTFNENEFRIAIAGPVTAAVVYLIPNGGATSADQRGSARMATVLAVAAALVAALAMTAPSIAAPQPDAELRMANVAGADLANVAVLDYPDRTLVRSNLQPDTKPDADMDVATGEWELLLHADPGCTGKVVLHLHYVNDPTYGPRIWTTVAGPLVALVGSVEIIHDGPSDHHHVDELGPGRHSMACEDAA